MSMINGITVVLYERTQTGVDGFNNPVYDEKAVSVDNVLVFPVEDKDIVDALQLYGKEAVASGLIDKLGGLNDALAALHKMIDKNTKTKKDNFAGQKN